MGLSSITAAGAKKVKSKVKVAGRHARRGAAKRPFRSRVRSFGRLNTPRTDDRRLPTSKRECALTPFSGREFVDAILETTATIIVVMDAAERIVFFNQASERASGRRSKEVISAVARDLLVPAEEREGARRIFEKLRSSRYPIEYEIHWQRPDGTRRVIAWSKTNRRAG